MDCNNQSVIMTRCETLSYVLKISTNPTYDFSFPSQSNTDFRKVEPNKFMHDFGFLLSSLFISFDRNTLQSYMTFSTTYIIKARKLDLLGQ